MLQTSSAAGARGRLLDRGRRDGAIDERARCSGDSGCHRTMPGRYVLPHATWLASGVQGVRRAQEAAQDDKEKLNKVQS